MKVQKKTILLIAVSIFFILTAVFVTPSGELLAQKSTPDEPFGEGEDNIVSLANTIFKFGVVLCVLAAAIYIALGAFAYFAATGNTAMVERGKEIIQRSIIGLILALIAWIILNTIHPQFAGQLKEPKLPEIKGEATIKPITPASSPPHTPTRGLPSRF